MRPAALALALLAACASTKEVTRPLDRSRPVDVEESRWSGPKFKQDGVPVDSGDLLAAVTSTPAAAEHFRSSVLSGVRGYSLGGLGAGLLLGSFFAHDPNTDLGLKLAACGAFVGFYAFGQRAIGSQVAAVRAYNASLAPPAAPPASPSSAAPPPRARPLSVSLSFEF